MVRKKRPHQPHFDNWRPRSPRGACPPSPVRSPKPQTGLDVDIWFRTQAGENPHKIKQVPMLDSSWNNINKKYWDMATVEILAEAASFDEVERIFVNPVIKRELCHKHAGEPWMNKIRAWWGHAGHFHVRLKCPATSPDCKMQKPVPDGDGCGEELDWWFSDEAKLGKTQSVPRQYPVLPKECKVVFEARD